MGSVRFDRHIARFTQSLADGQCRNSHSRSNALAFDRLVIASVCPPSSNGNAKEQSIACSAIPIAAVHHGGRRNSRHATLTVRCRMGRFSEPN